MKIGKLILIALVISAYATVSVINIQLAKPKDVAEVTLDMLDVMSRAFDESEGGEGGGGSICQNFSMKAHYYVSGGQIGLMGDKPWWVLTYEVVDCCNVSNDANWCNFDMENSVCNSNLTRPPRGTCMDAPAE